ncbi:transglycosylase domain-containing protein [Streptomyces sp. ISL-36]|uniref:transglycosylase domain-containing protein n=1 Tax=Streptomyces sp. ISL-36 TaxID=2819182 RepID=UPI001BE7E43E|nr:transglycosylase domain-containing protein [Streptomyces sp. ISL-36]MBT2443171.1 transglycosylase domain-containing protein [Streptomyces sp. ISL-36]
MSDAQPTRSGWEPRDPTLPAKPPAPSKAEKRPRRRVLRWLLGTFLLVTLLLTGGFVAGYLLVDIPPANATAIAQSNVYLYKDGTQIARDGEVNRENVRLARVPLPVQHAVLAAEDRDFYSDRAVDPKAMVRAAWKTVTGKGKQSGSTITQQYVKNYYLVQEQTVTRKVKEFFIAIRLNREKSKDEIFEGYLNTSYFGRNAYGIQAAARAYYGKDSGELDTAQGAYLASLLNAPSAYDVATHPENRTRALARWNYVLDGMVKEKWLTPADRAAMRFPTPQTARPATGLSGQRGYIVQAVEEYLTSNGVLDENTLAGGGHRITTTLEKAKQDAFVAAVDDQVMSKLDPVRNPVDRFVRVGGAAIEPATGRVVALYGGVDYTKQYVNNATRRDYQVGSAFKPFVLTAAVERGSHTQEGEPITPNTYYDGTNKRPVQGWSGGLYDPANEDDVSYGDITVRAATDSSVNAVYAQMAVDVGPAKVKETAVALGLPADTPDLNASPSIALGTATASVLDMAEAYATLANHGRHGRHTLVDSISKDGEELELPAAESTQAVGREAADTTTSVLRSVVESGTGTAALSAGRPAAGKTGTAEDDKAAWFAGYTPDLATVVTMMGQDPGTGEQKPLYGALGRPRINGGGAPAEIWGQFTRDALAGTEAREFELQLAEGMEEPPAPPVPPLPDVPEEPGQEQEQEQEQARRHGFETAGQGAGSPASRTSTPVSSAIDPVPVPVPLPDTATPHAQPPPPAPPATP